MSAIISTFHRDSCSRDDINWDGHASELFVVSATASLVLCMMLTVLAACFNFWICKLNHLNKLLHRVCCTAPVVKHSAPHLRGLPHCQVHDDDWPPVACIKKCSCFHAAQGISCLAPPVIAGTLPTHVITPPQQVPGLHCPQNRERARIFQ